MLKKNNFKKLKAELTPYKKSFPANYLINEYNQMFNEIRYINDKISTYVKVFLIVLSSYISYTILGLKFVLNNPNSIAGLLYGGFGVLISVLMYALIYLAQRQYSASKKHKTRYWKSIQYLRKILCDVLPEVKHYLLLPVGDNDNRDKPRPDISGGEESIGKAWVWVNYIFFVISFFYFWIFLEFSWHGMHEPDKLPDKLSVLREILENGITTYVQPHFYKAILTSLICISLLSSFPFSQPEKPLWHYHKNLYLAKKISLSDPYPKIVDNELIKPPYSKRRILYDSLSILAVVLMFVYRFYAIVPDNLADFLTKQGVVYFLCIILISLIELFRYNYKKKALGMLLPVGKAHPKN